MPYNITISAVPAMPADFRPGRKSTYTPILQTMNIGDSFKFPANRRSNTYGMAKRAGIKVRTTTQKAPRNKVLVFRVA